MHEDVKLFADFFSRSYNVNISESTPVLGTLSPAELPRGSILQREGARSDHAFFLAHGAARAYHLHDGEEHVTWLAFEGDVLASLTALSDEAASETIELVERSRLVRIDMATLRQHIGRDVTATLLALATVTAHARGLEEEVRALRTLSASQRYQHLLKREPHVLQRVRLQDVASYLGLARETLSRIRGARL